ncbi:MAG TPA: beta-1,6-glucan synthase [Xanthobacteraceae bacterium]|nr:beta-1,6-glucan synthase [Xanthobacteraceae bacterium]
MQYASPRQAIFLLAVVAALIGVVWHGLGQPVLMPPSPLAASEKIPCLSYTPFRGLQSPLDDVVAGRAAIEDDLKRISRISGCVLTYAATHGLEHVPEIARGLGLTVIQGIWLSRDAARNRAEVESAIALARRYPGVIRAIVAGNEVFLRGEMNPEALAPVIARVKSAAGVPVTYAETWEYWLQNRELAAAVDFVTIHVLPYGEDFPVPAAETAARVVDVQRRVAANFPGKEVFVGEAGWPSAGRMREGALPSASNQARVVHDLLAAAKRFGFRLSIPEAFDQPWRQRVEGTAGGHWGWMTAGTREPKFRLGAPVSDHSLWLYEGLAGILLAVATFAAASASGRTVPGAPPIDWFKIAGVALLGGVVAGWAIVDTVIESVLISTWIYSGLLLIAALLAPPLVAAALARGTPAPGFGTLLDPAEWRAADRVGRAAALLLGLTVVLAIHAALGLVFDPRLRDFPFAPLTGPAAAFAALAFSNARARPTAGIAEYAAAALLGASAAYIALSEGPENWQALWFCAGLAVLAAACARLGSAPGGRSS